MTGCTENLCEYCIKKEFCYGMFEPTLVPIAVCSEFVNKDSDLMIFAELDDEVLCD